tara:strand:+ start:343 stop:549 length:207 start_codon:yes stop_codon:yes gene_type:complete
MREVAERRRAAENTFVYGCTAAFGESAVIEGRRIAFPLQASLRRDARHQLTALLQSVINKEQPPHHLT